MSKVEELPDSESEDETPKETFAEKQKRLAAEADIAGEGVDIEAATRVKAYANDLFVKGKTEEALVMYLAGQKRAPLKPVPKPKPIHDDHATKPRPPPPGFGKMFGAFDEEGKTTVDTADLPPAAETAEQSQDGEGKEEQPPAATVEEEPEDTTDYTVTAQLMCNAGAALIKLKRWDEAVKQLSEAIRHDTKYTKAYYRRADCNWNLEQWGSCYTDLEECEKQGMRLDSVTLERKAVAKKKMDEEIQKMWGQLKDVGNMFLGKFGLSTDNFKFNKDPNTGGYTMNFEQSPGGKKPES